MQIFNDVLNLESKSFVEKYREVLSKTTKVKFLFQQTNIYLDNNKGEHSPLIYIDKLQSIIKIGIFDDDYVPGENFAFECFMKSLNIIEEEQMKTLRSIGISGCKIENGYVDVDAYFKDEMPKK